MNVFQYGSFSGIFSELYYYHFATVLVVDYVSSKENLWLRLLQK